MKLKILLRKLLQKIQFNKFVLKSKFRKKILKIRENNNKKNIKIDFDKIKELFKKEKISKKIIGGYYPVNFEVDDLELLRILEKDNFKIALPVIKKNYQTLSYYGVHKDDLISFFKTNKPLGVDRVVPIGNTLDFSLNWDGYDLINQMSRIIEIN